jgi:hypothetical protein
LPALSLNWVMRFIQPMRATQLKIQASSACCGTADWLKTICFFGIDAGGDERGRNRADLVTQILMHQLRGDRVQVDDAIDAVVISCSATNLRMAPR